MKRAVLLTGLASFAGCSGMNDLSRPGDAAGPDAPGTLLVNIYPGDESGLRPQSFEVAPAEGGYPSLDLRLEDTVTISGLLTAAVAHVWSAVGAPSTPEPFVGTIEISKRGTIQNAATLSDETGAFSLQIPAGTGYDLLLTPGDATIMAARSSSGQSYFQDRDLTQEFDDGAPLFGRITANGLGVSKAPLVLTQIDPDPQVASNTFYSDSDGWYSARLPVAGTYSLAVQGGLSGIGVTLPTVSRRVTTGEDGTKLDIDVGTISAAVLTGSVVDESGDPVADATIRLASTALDGEGTLEVETTTDESGSFVTRVVPGQFIVEVLPRYEDELTPVAVAVTAVSGSLDIPAMTLPAWKTVSGVVSLPDGGPAEGVTVAATEVGWSGYAYSTMTDAKGKYTLDLPNVAFTLVCTPPTSSGAALTRVDLPVDGDPSVSLVPGEAVSGRAQSSGGTTPFALVEVWDGATNLLLGTALTDSDGAFQLVIDPPLVSDGDSGGDSADTGDTADTGGKDTGGKDTGTDTGDTDTGDADTGRDTGGTDTGL